VAERKSELAKLESIDCGKPLDEAEWDMVRVHGPQLSVNEAVDHLNYVVENCCKFGFLCIISI
jgi:hypothetical protein